MTQRSIQRDVDHVVRDLARLVHGRDANLVAIHVSRPAQVSASELSRRLTAALAEAGLDFIDIYTHDEEGPVRLVSASLDSATGSVP